MRALLIANPASRKLMRGLQAESLAERLQGPDTDVTCRLTSAPGEASALACEAPSAGFDTVVVAGGDGTVREAVDGLVGTDVPLGIIPTGTGNVLRRHLRLPRSAEGACEVIKGGRTQRFDLGRGGGRHFVLHAGAGHDANVVRRVPAPMKAALGELAFVGAMVQVLAREQQWRMHVRVDDAEWEGRAWAVIVANSSSYAWRMRLVPHARTDDGLLDVAIFGACGVLAFAGLHIRALLGEHLKSRHVHVLRGTEVEVHAEPTAPVQMDGDLVGITPLRCAVVPAAISLIVP
ncbi:MAG: diacylglycerol kinase family lipid kinase [Armatimonadota bacterium]|jgi:diacylglycerol kinase (ATP)